MPTLKLKVKSKTESSSTSTDQPKEVTGTPKKKSFSEIRKMPVDFRFRNLYFGKK